MKHSIVYSIYIHISIRIINSYKYLNRKWNANQNLVPFLQLYYTWKRNDKKTKELNSEGHKENNKLDVAGAKFRDSQRKLDARVQEVRPLSEAKLGSLLDTQHHCLFACSNRMYRMRAAINKWNELIRNSRYAFISFGKLVSLWIELWVI